MAVLGDARLRTVGVRSRGVTRTSRVAARVAPLPVPRARRRLRPTGVLMAAILTGTMLALVYLTQTLASNAASLEIHSLARTTQDLQSQLLNQSTKIELVANPDAVIREARKLGLEELGEAIVLEAP